MFASIKEWFRNHVRSIRIAKLEEKHRKDVKAFLDKIDKWGLTVRKGRVVGNAKDISISNDARVELEVEYKTIVWEHQQALKAL